MKFKSSLSILFSLVLGCTATVDRGEIVRIDVYDQSSLQIQIEKVVCLEDKEEAIIGGVDRLSHIDHKILIHDRRSAQKIILYDSSGVFIRSLSQGKGAGELVTPTDYSISDEKVHILDIGQKKVVVTDLDLHVVEERKAEVFARNFHILDKNTWLLYSQSPGYRGDKAYSFMLYNPAKDYFESTILPLEIDDLRRVSLGNTISRDNKNIVFCRPFDHRIYSYSKSQLKVEYYLDFGDLNVNLNDLKEGLPIVYEKMRNGERVSIDGGLINNDSFLAASFAFEAKLHFFIFSKVNGSVYTSVSSQALPQGKLVGYHQNNFILLVSPRNMATYFLEREDRDKFEYDGSNYCLFYFSAQ